MQSFKIGDLEVKLPLVLGGMGVGVTLSGLASAIANEGGIGMLSSVGVGYNSSENGKFSREISNEKFREEIRKTRTMTQGLLGANIMFALTNFDDLFKISLEEHLDIVSVGAGMLIKLPETVTLEEFVTTKTKILPKISSARAAELIFKVWADKFGKIPEGVVIEGPLAGGHLGFNKNEIKENRAQELFIIFKEVKEVLKKYEDRFGHKITVIVAGGIYTGGDIYHALQEGADAVKMASRFVTSNECDAHINFKMEYINATEKDITIIDSPVGLPGRVIENEFVRRLKRGETRPIKCPWKCLKTCDFRKVPYCIAQALINAAQGNLDEGFAFAGYNAYRATKIQPVAEIISELKAEYAEAERNSKN